MPGPLSLALPKKCSERRSWADMITTTLVSLSVAERGWVTGALRKSQGNRNVNISDSAFALPRQSAHFWTLMDLLHQ
eukprot:scaffold35179_cov36-Tisochrysis_lutea.AAC.1